MEEGPLRVWVGAVRDRSPTATTALARPDRSRSDRCRRRPRRRVGRYGPLVTDYVLCGPDEAECAGAPDRWPDDEPQCGPWSTQEAEQRGLRTLVFGRGDLEPIVRSAAAIVVHPGPTRGAQPAADVLALPYIHTDRWAGPMDRADDERPSVAFCGQAANRRGMGLAHGARRLVDRARAGRLPAVVTPPVRGHIGLRARALRVLSDHPGVDDRFVIRDRYRAGGAALGQARRAEGAFDDNLRSATYALCVRGTGNFSARFFEALSFGRIPLLVDTDNVLPFEDEIDWSAHVVKVDARVVHELGHRLISEHAGGTDGPRSSAALRRLWEERLTQSGFYGHLPAAVRRLC